MFALKCTARGCGLRFNYVEMVPIENTELRRFFTSTSALLTALCGLESHFGLAN